VQQLRETERELALHIQELESDIRDGTFQRSAELMAREKLGMVKPGERIFYPAGN
jgi:cell division protein FtsB